MSGIGHIGELEVIHHLEKQKGFVYLPIKDKGIDFIAVKQDHSFQIQVKCSAFQKRSYFWFDLKKERLIYGRNIFSEHLLCICSVYSTATKVYGEIKELSHYTVSGHTEMGQDWVCC